MGDSETEALMIREVLCHCYDALFHFSGLFLVNVSAAHTPDARASQCSLTWSVHLSLACQGYNT